MEDAEVRRYLGPSATFGREDAWRELAVWLGHWALRGYGQWAVEIRATKELIGRVGLHYPEGWPGLEVGWALARPYWG
ncbi:MAG: GNAT family N-acetyltransferase, partial [Actinomycetota bacterium]